MDEGANGENYQSSTYTRRYWTTGLKEELLDAE